MRARTVEFQCDVLNEVFSMLLVALLELVHVDFDRLLDFVGLALSIRELFANYVYIVY